MGEVPWVEPRCVGLRVDGRQESAIAAQLVAPVDLPDGRAPRFALHGGDLAVDGIPRRGVAVRQIISHAPLPYNHRRIARGPADAAFIPAHE